jgi:hypothetical protein
VAIAVGAVLAGGCGRLDFGDVTQPYRIPLTIDHTQVAGDLTDFPVLVPLTQPGLVAHAAPDRHDLAFTDALGEPLAYEREGSDAAWVKLPAVSAEVDTVFDVAYGDPSQPDQSRPTDVWSNGFVGVYHFGDGTTLDVHDSTGVNDGSNAGAAALGSAIIGGGLALDGGPIVTSATVGADTSDAGLNTVTMWLDYTGGSGGAPVGFQTDEGVLDVWFVTTACVGFNTQQGEVLGTTNDLTQRWIYLAMVFNNGIPTAGESQLVVDGAPQVLTTCNPGTPAPRSVGGTADWGGDPGFEMTGAIDEARLANVARPAAWTATEYANQSSPATFVTAAAEQTP